MWKFIKNLFTRTEQEKAMRAKYDLVSRRGFWDDLPGQFVCLAPMADVTDAAFRQMFAKYGKPDITWTEFVSADGLFLRPETPDVIPETDLEKLAAEYKISADHPLLRDLIYSDNERPAVAQFFSRDEGRMEKAAELTRRLGYDGLDINMGCPAKVICRQGAGSAMIKDPVHAQKVIQAAIRGAGDMPVSVKTRIGFSKNEIETWMPALINANPVAITLHARTRSQMSKVPADWTQIRRAVEIRDALAPHIKIIGNGDVKSREEAFARMAETGCDGVMIGRGVFGNPWVFNPDIKKADVEPKEICRVLVEHVDLFEKYLGDVKSFYLMKKHFKAYLSGWEGAKELRTDLIQNANNPAEVRAIMEKYSMLY